MDIWVLTNSEGYFINAYETREKALEVITAYRNNLERSGIFAHVSKVDAVYYERITFTATDREGKQRGMRVTKTVLG